MPTDNSERGGGQTGAAVHPSPPTYAAPLPTQVVQSVQTMRADPNRYWPWPWPQIPDASAILTSRRQKSQNVVSPQPPVYRVAHLLRERNMLSSTSKFRRWPGSEDKFTAKHNFKFGVNISFSRSRWATLYTKCIRVVFALQSIMRFLSVVN